MELLQLYIAWLLWGADRPAYLCCLCFSIAAYACAISFRLQQYQLLLCCVNLSTRLQHICNRNQQAIKQHTVRGPRPLAQMQVGPKTDRT